MGADAQPEWVAKRRKKRRLKTRVGSLELRIPKDREGRFQPSLFARYQRSERALVLALMEMYVQGVSTRKVTGSWSSCVASPSPPLR